MHMRIPTTSWPSRTTDEIRESITHIRSLAWNWNSSWVSGTNIGFRSNPSLNASQISGSSRESPRTFTRPQVNDGSASSS